MKKGKSKSSDLKTIKYDDLSLDNELVITITKREDNQIESFVIEKEEFDYDLTEHGCSSYQDFRKLLFNEKNRCITIHFQKDDELLLVL